MKAMTSPCYGGPETMTLQDVPTPTPGDGEVLVAVRATSLQALDWHLQTGEPWILRLQQGLRRPKRTIHGVDIAGVVEAVGGAVDDLAPGTEVFGWAADGGGLAEHVVVPRDHIRPRPRAIGLEEAGTLGVAAFTALQAVRDHGRVGPGDRVLVVGASSGVGHFAVQLASAAGAHVTGVCSRRNIELVRAVGADEVIDRLVEDWSATDRTWDVILQVTGSVPYGRARARLARDGRYVMAGVDAPGRVLGPMLPFLRMLVRRRFDRRVHVVQAKENAADLATIAEAVDDGSLRPVIDRRFPLAAAAAAMRYVLDGRAGGKVVVTV